MLTEFKNYLQEHDISFEDVTSDILIFNRNKFRYVFNCDSNDPYYIRIILPGVKKVTSENQRDIENAILKCNAETKVAKGIIVKESLWISVEQLVYSKENIDKLFDRLLIIIDAYIDCFLEHCQNTEKSNK